MPLHCQQEASNNWQQQQQRYFPLQHLVSPWPLYKRLMVLLFPSYDSTNPSLVRALILNIARLFTQLALGGGDVDINCSVLQF